ncbi:MAG TPA: hypothetical protein VF131_25920 [Blastocatellia bacterium]|nr:hypothetical protein [Blastocatellia bacterium]
MASRKPETVTTTKEAEAQQKPKRLKKRWVALAILAVILAWVAYDMYGPRSTSMRSFDPDEVARLETAMWKSYYARERVKLFTELSELLRTQYNMPYVRSNAVAYSAAKAAFVFKDGRNRADYEKALPDLRSFYTEIRKISDISFDVERASQLELEWWIIHRERKTRKPGELDRALADLPAELYGVAAERLMEHARLRAQAMTIRDDKAEAGGVTEEDWAKIDELLHASWQSLWRAVNS